MTGSQDNKNEKVMYCKDKIYCGIEEYSFEELRAVRWLRRQEQLKQEKEAEAVQGLLNTFTQLFKSPDTQEDSHNCLLCFFKI